MFTFNHFNFNVLDLERSVRFYHDALGLEPVRTKNAADGSFRLVFLGDGHSPFQLELTGLRGRTQPLRPLMPSIKLIEWPLQETVYCKDQSK